MVRYNIRKPKVEKPSKYKNKKVEAYGRIFDSKMELEYYEYILQELENGDIVDYKFQPRFELIPPFEKGGKKYRKTEYVADFIVTYPSGKRIVIDIKGFKTADFKLKEKLFNLNYRSLELKLITKTKEFGWIELHDLERVRKQRKKEKKEK